MRKILKNLFMVLRHGVNAEVLLHEHRGDRGQCVVAICRNADGGIWAIEKNALDALEKQANNEYAKTHTHLVWMKALPTPELDWCNKKAF